MKATLRITMVVDDDPFVRDILRVGLARFNQDVFLAANGREALRYAQAIEVSMVVLDLDMPVLNGLNTCEQLRRLPGFAMTPIIILTGHDDEAAREAARRVGATEFISKPFRPVELMGRLSHFLQLKPQELSALQREAERACRSSRCPQNRRRCQRTHAARRITGPTPSSGQSIF